MGFFTCFMRKIFLIEKGIFLYSFAYLFLENVQLCGRWVAPAESNDLERKLTYTFNRMQNMKEGASLKVDLH